MNDGHLIDPKSQQCVYCRQFQWTINKAFNLSSPAALRCPENPNFKAQMEQVEIRFKEERYRIYEEIFEKENQVTKLQLEIANLRKRL